MTQDETNNLLTFIAATYPSKAQEVTELTAQAWHSYLSPFSLAQVKESFDDWVKSGKEWPPSVAELYRLVIQNKDLQNMRPSSSTSDTFETYSRDFVENGKTIKRFYQRATRDFKQNYLKSQNLSREKTSDAETGESCYVLKRND